MIEILRGPQELIEFDVTAKSWEGRIPARHEFKWLAADKDAALAQIKQRWPALYDIDVRRT